MEDCRNSMSCQEEFLLKWDDHHTSFFTIAEDLCRSELLCDVTLACGGEVFRTHKLILCICSPYFRTLLTTHPDQHPIIYLKDVNPKHLEQLLSYMYKGEVNIPQGDLEPLIETARGLQITLLTDTCTNSKFSSTTPKENRTIPHDRSHQRQTSPTKQLLTPPLTPSKTTRISENNDMDKSFSIITVEPPDNIIMKEEEIELNLGDGVMKQEVWTENTFEEEGENCDIFSEQCQTEEEKDIKEGTDEMEQEALSTLSQKHTFIPRGQYNLEDMASAFTQVLESGETVAKMARKYNVPRKTLENYVSGRTNILNLYKKIGKHTSHKHMIPHSCHSYKYNSMKLVDMYATNDMYVKNVNNERLPYGDLPAPSNYI